MTRITSILRSLGGPSTVDQNARSRDERGRWGEQKRNYSRHFVNRTNPSHWNLCEDFSSKRRVREHYQWAQIAAEIERVYFEMMGWQLAEIGARRPMGRVAAAAAAGQRKAG